MARVMRGKECVFESEDDAQILDYVNRGGPLRVKCCGQIFHPSRGRWGVLASHFAEHVEPDVPETAKAPPVKSPARTLTGARTFSRAKPSTT